MTHFKRYLFLFLYLSCFTSKGTELPARVFIFNDSLGKYTIQTITSKQFSESKDHSPNLAFSNSILWVKMDVPEISSQAIITIENAHLDHLDCYVFSKDSLVRTFKTGDLHLFKSRDINTNFFSFLLNKGENIYFKASTKGSLALPIRVHELNEYFGYDRTNQVIIWMYIGIAFVALFANVLFFITLKETSYLYYSFYVFANIIYVFTDVELNFQYIWPNHPEYNKLNLLFYSCPVFTLIFCNYFLQTKRYLPFLHRINVIIIVLQIIGGAYSLIDYKTGALISSYSFVLVPFVIFITAILIYIKSHNKIILLFLASWSLYLIGVIVYIGCVLGLLEYYASISNSIFIATSIEMILIFVIVIYNINSIKEENINSKNEIIQLLSDKEKMMGAQNQLLEAKVIERTKVLQIKNEEISSQNEEIASQNEELFQKQSLLEQKNYIITLTNKELTDYKEHLEEIVEKRTVEIKHANHDLENKNKQLEQFAFMAAHNLRSPVATIIGLTSLMEDDNTPETQREVVKRISGSVRKLDIIVKSLSSILSDPKVTLKLFEECDFEILTKESKDILFTEINDSNAEIVTNFEQCSKISSVKAYLHNLFYNMMSNAMKYRKTSEIARIEISTKKEGDKIHIIFKDYGIGMNLALNGSEIFTPFKRFNTKIDGAGVGLYLIKTQMEALGGSIRVESELGIGTTFWVVLPNTEIV